MTWLGWYDPDRKKPVRVKLADAVERYTEKFGRAPRFCLTHAQDAEELTNKGKGPEPSVEVHARNYIARWTYYVGEHLEGGPAVYSVLMVMTEGE